MSATHNTGQLLAILDKVARCYPGGIPRGAISAPHVQSKIAAVDCVLVALEPAGKLEERLRALAEAIGTKGLRLSAERFLVRSVPAGSFGDVELQALVPELAPKVMVVCGGGASPGTLVEVGDTLLLHSYGLSLIADSVDTKKRFWEHLKLVMPRLDGTTIKGAE
jgi:hypothetical protein